MKTFLAVFFSLLFSTFLYAQATSPTSDAFSGKLILQARYQHVLYKQPSELWVKQKPDGSIVAVAKQGEQVAVAVGDAAHRPVRYSTGSGTPLTNKMHFVIDANKARQLASFEDEKMKKEYTFESGSLFDPNTRPDPYAMANILLRQFNVKPGESKEFTMCDWSNAGDKSNIFPSYRVRVENKGKESVTVPAGTFNAWHVVQTQLTSADTWFKKRAEHVTDFWYLDDFTIVRILRHREPYEVVLQEYYPAATSSTQPASQPAAELSEAKLNEYLAEIEKQQFGGVEGIIQDETMGATAEEWQKLYTVSPEHYEEVEQGLTAIYCPRGVDVLLVGDTITSKTVTGDMGKFGFDKVMEGTYDLIATRPPVIPGGPERIVRTKIIVPNPRPARLSFTWPDLTIKGRVVDEDGKPIAGAQVEGMLTPISEVGVPKTIRAMTNQNGEFLMDGIKPLANLFRVFGYLNGGDPGADNGYEPKMEFTVKAQGYAQPSQTQTSIPLISEMQFKPARQYWQVMNAWMKQSGKGKPRDKMIDIPYQTKGNVISGITIKMQKEGQ